MHGSSTLVCLAILVVVLDLTKGQVSRRKNYQEIDGYERKMDMDCWGYDMKITRFTGVKDCAAACDSTQGCIGFVNPFGCYLKSKCDKFQNWKGAITYVKTKEPATTTEPPTTTAQAPLPLGCTAASDCGENANCDEGACVCNPGFGGDPKVSCKEYCTCEFLGDPLLSTFEGILEMVAGDFSFFDIGVCGLSSRVFLALQGDQLYPVKLTIRFRDLDITIWKNKTVEYQDSSSTLPDTVTLTDTPQVIPTHPDVKLSLENGYALVDITCNGEPVQVGFDPEGAKTRGVVVVPQSLADSIGQDPDSECGQCSGGNTT